MTEMLPLAAVVPPGPIEAGGYALGLFLFLYLRRRWRRGPALKGPEALWLAVGMILGSLAGAALTGWAESAQTLWRLAGDVAIGPQSHRGMGALLGGWIGVEIAKRLLRITHPSGDVFVFPLMLGLAISRVGRSLDGSVTYLYEAAFLALLAPVFIWRISTRRQRGCMFSQFVFAYLAFCFLIEFLRPRFVLNSLPLSAIQLVSLAGMIHALLHWNDECCGRPAAQTPPIEPQSQFLELTSSLCPTCLKKIEAKVLVEANSVYLQKFCPEHGLQRVLIADDAAWWRQARALYKPPTSPLRRNTSMKHGCPHDCGICPDHEQHSCLAILEITDRCDLNCPICYAASGAAREHRSLAQIELMLDSAIANEGKLNVVQVSGGEPTTHPDLFAVLDAIRKRPIRHLMLNTNGLRIAEDADFVARLASYMPGFEVYLQFDSLRPSTLKELRGADLADTRRRAVDVLEKHGISATLVVTLKKGVNDEEIGEILDFAIGHPNIRGVTFQPIQAAGRLGGFDAGRDRLTLTEVRSAILRQHSLFTPEDLVPVPCHTDALAMGYAIRRGGKMIPLSRLIDPRTLLGVGGNTICYEQDAAVREHLLRLFSASASPTSAADTINDLCCTPATLGPISYQNVFRVIIMQFMDAWSMDLRSLKRSCVHIIHPDGRLIPFETYNLLYRPKA